MRLMALSTFFLLCSGCGSNLPPGAQVASAHVGEGFFIQEEPALVGSEFPATDAMSGDKSAFNVSTTAKYVYKRSEPTYVNGRPQREHEYWSCVQEVVARFSRPVSYVSLLGSVVGKGPYVTDRPLSLTEISADGKTATFAPAGTKGMCAERFTHNQVELSSAIRDVSGQRLGRASTVALAYGPGRDRLNKGMAFEESQLSDGKAAFVDQQSYELGVLAGDSPSGDFGDAFDGHNHDHDEDVGTQSQKDFESCERRVGDNCLVNLSPSVNLSIAKINSVYQQIADWTAREKNSSVYGSSRIQRLQTTGTIIVPRGPNSTERHYAFPDVLYSVRYSAKFVQFLFPSLQSIGVADLTTADGQTPSTSLGSSRQFLHPRGSHQGQDADIGYISVGSGNERKAAIDIEKNFWLLYAALQSAGVDLVYTAYKDEFIEYARKARDKGLINEVAYGRFRSARIIKDRNLGHDTHFHFKVSYRDYQGESLRFQPADDVYNCLLGLGLSGASEQNFCRRL